MKRRYCSYAYISVREIKKTTTAKSWFIWNFYFLARISIAMGRGIIPFINETLEYYI